DAKGVRLWLVAGARLRSSRVQAASVICGGSSSGVSTGSWGGGVSGLQPSRQGGAGGFLDLRLCWGGCAKSSNELPSDSANARIKAVSDRISDGIMGHTMIEHLAPRPKANRSFGA